MQALVAKFRKTIIVSMMAVAMTVGIGAVAASPAIASEAWSVNTNRACQQQFGGGTFGASLYGWSPNSIYCYGVSFPWGVTWMGALSKGRIDAYCKATRPGSRAVIGSGWRDPKNAWWCKKG